MTRLKRSKKSTTHKSLKIRATRQIPAHLRRYLIKQNYNLYTPEDHAVWRFIMRELTQFLYKFGHPSYKAGLVATGVSLDKIPDLRIMDKKLKKIGWRAAAVSGFIPPASFMELQAYGVLPIATEMRRVENLEYTPAPDIVHEAAGHAPMLANKQYSKYLRNYTAVASKAIITRKDLDQYEAIRELSDLKERPEATDEAIAAAYARLEVASKAIVEPTEAVLLTRMGWWTTEYGLIGSLHKPKIFGAGLFSSVGESRNYLNPKVKKIPFSIDCLKYPYDITDPQPQLFVAKKFGELERGLEALASEMAFTRGGVFGLERMKKAETVNTIELCSGLQISGQLDLFSANGEDVEFIKLKGPTQLSFKNKLLKGHDKKYHLHGYSTPVGTIANLPTCMSEMSDSELKKCKVECGKQVVLSYTSGIQVSGKLQKMLRKDGKLLVLTFTECTVTRGTEVLYRPEWGPFDLGTGCRVVSVFGGAADRAAYGPTEDFVAKILEPRKLSVSEKRLQALFSKTRRWLSKKTKVSPKEVLAIWSEVGSQFPKAWLLMFELLELMNRDRKHFLDYPMRRQEMLKAAEAYPNTYPYVINSLKMIEGKFRSLK